MQANTESVRLLSTVKDLLPDIDITLDNIKNPTKNFVESFYQAVLIELGVDKSSLLQMSAQQMGCVQYIDMYQAIIPYINMMKGMKYIFDNLAVKDFGLSDILNPNPRRTFNLMNLLMNFLYYCDNKICELDPGIDEVEERHSQKQNMEKMMESLKQKLNEHLSKRNERTQTKLRLQSIIDEKRRTLEDLVVRESCVKEKIDTINAGLKKSSSERDRQVQLKTELEDELKRLESLIVESPEKLKDQLERLKVKKEQVVAECSEQCTQVEEKKKATEFITNHIKDQKHRQELFDDIKKYYTEIGSIREDYEVATNRISKMCAEIKEKQGLNEKLREKFYSKKQQLKETVTDSEAQLNTYRMEVKNISENLKELKGRMANVSEEKKKCEERIQQLTILSAKRKTELENIKQRTSRVIENLDVKITVISEELEKLMKMLDIGIGGRFME